MKHLSLILITLAITAGITAQEKVKQSEIGLVFNNLNNFGVGFKVGSNKFKWRFNTMLLSSSTNKLTNDSTNTETESKRSGFGVSIGHQFQKPISENFEFLFGYDFFYNSTKSKYDDGQELTYYVQKYRNPGFNIVLAFNYIFKEHLLIGAEILPYVSWSKTITEREYKYVSSTPFSTSENKRFSYGLTNTSVRLNLAYRF